MVDTSEESSREGSDSISSDKFSVDSESSTSDENEQNEEASASYSSVRKCKSHSEELSLPSKQAVEKTRTTIIKWRN